MTKSRLAIILLLIMGISNAEAQLTSELEIFSDSFISSSFGATSKTDYQFFAADLKTDPISSDPLRIDISGAVALGAPLLNYMNLSELYTTQDLNSNQKITIGRAKFLWSELDARWELGVWEPVFKWNPLSPERQGLSGLFWQAEKSGFELTLFASPLFLPDQGPSFDLDNGRFVKSNPWFRRPPESIRIFNETTAIEYQFLKPNESNIIFHSSYGGRLLIADSDKVRWSLSYIYKPMNQLALAYDGALDIAKDKGVISLKPEVVYHTLLGTDLVLQNKKLRYGISSTIDRPNKEKVFEQNLTSPVFTDALLVSGFVEYDSGPIKLSIQRMQIFGGDISEVGKLASAERRPLMTRYSFKQANEFSGVLYKKLGANRRLELKTSIMGSDDGSFLLTRTHGTLNISSLWQIFGELQLIKASTDRPDSQNEIINYANNDRFMLGASYAF